MSCAKTAEAIDLPFGLWTQVRPRKHKFNHIQPQAQIQSYLPGGANVPSWKGTLAPPGEYDWTLSLCSNVALYQIWPLVTTRAMLSAVLGVVILSVCLSVRLSHACFVTNPKNLLAIFLCHTKGQSFYFSDAKDLSEIPTGSPPTGAPKRGGVG